MADIAELEVRIVDRIDASIDQKIARLEKGITGVEKNLGSLDGGFSRFQRTIITLGSGVDLVRGAFGLFERAVGAGLAVLDRGVAIVGRLTDAASEQDDAITQLNARLVSTGRFTEAYSNELQGLAGNLQQVTRYGDEATISAEALLLSFRKIGKDVFPEAIERIQDVATAMGGDLLSATKQVGKALNEPAQALTALQRSGIQFTEAQQRQIKALVAANDVLGAQRIILDELRTQFGGSARAAADNYRGAVASLTNAYSDLEEELGAVITHSRTVQIVIREVAAEFLNAAGEVKTFRSDNEQIEAVFQDVARGAFEATKGVIGFTRSVVGSVQAVQEAAPAIKLLLAAFAGAALGTGNVGLAAAFIALTSSVEGLRNINFDPVLAGLDSIEGRVDSIRERVEKRFQFTADARSIDNIEAAFKQRADKIAALKADIAKPADKIAAPFDLPATISPLGAGTQPGAIQGAPLTAPSLVSGDRVKELRAELQDAEAEARVLFAEFSRRGIDASESTRKLAQSLGITGAAARGLGREGEAGFGAVDKATEKARDRLEQFAESIRDSTRTPLEQINDFGAELQKAFDAGLISAEQMNQAMVDFTESTIGGTAATERLRGAAAKLYADTRTSAEAMQIALDDATEAARGFTDEAQRAEVVARAHAQITEQFEAEAQALRDMVNPAEKLERQIANVNKVAAEFPQILDEATKGKVIEKLRDDFNDLGKSGKESMEDLRRATEGFGRDFSKTFADAVTGGKADFEDLVRSITRDLLELSIHKGITEPFFVKPLDKLFGGGGDGGPLFDFFFGGGSSKAPTSPFAGPGSTELQLATDPFAAVAEDASNAFVGAADDASRANIAAANVAGQGWLSVANRVGGAFMAILGGGSSGGGSGILGTIIGGIISVAGSYFGGTSIGQGSGALGLVNQGSGGFSTIGGQSSVGELPGVYHRGGMVVDWPRFHDGWDGTGSRVAAQLWSRDTAAPGVPGLPGLPGKPGAGGRDSYARESVTDRLIERFYSREVTDRQREMAMRLMQERLAPNEVPAILERGELVIPRREVPMVEELMERANRRLERFHDGGMVGGGSGRTVETRADGDKASGQGITVQVQVNVGSLDPRTAASTILANMPAIEAAINDGVRRGRIIGGTRRG